ncbi:MAG TPA: four helix bundle protein [Ignavibacteriaceae bacterium]|nr:four helix bundle protein [Ignavibacteriaceae bacterium]
MSEQRIEMSTHKDLIVWKKSIEFVTEVYKITGTFPSEEKFGLVSQLRRAAVSIPSNIAEGAARNHDKEFIQFLSISLGSASEIETQLIMSLNLNFISEDVFNELNLQNMEIKKMLSGLIKSIKNK